MRKPEGHFLRMAILVCAAQQIGSHSFKDLSCLPLHTSFLVPLGLRSGSSVHGVLAVGGLTQHSDSFTETARAIARRPEGFHAPTASQSVHTPLSCTWSLRVYPDANHTVQVGLRGGGREASGKEQCLAKKRRSPRVAVTRRRKTDVDEEGGKEKDEVVKTEGERGNSSRTTWKNGQCVG
eukprot:CAMPEP_0177701066 /NCGR_PEP_ID=MMETSP0484_2-20121128/6422_1 /TAXON_ID=354590 /ORGANISM="Rhodomonas lens, Strain RHODO" /LENGTH=179 /DNA_ID=CAMNT_0019212293 /DNA_START=408 /DNA_END=943 /DNA_ORIENTATION=+